MIFSPTTLKKHVPAMEKQVLGWREWLHLPDLGIREIKAKVDTGARSSSLHAFDIEERRSGNRTVISFRVHPMQRDSRKTIRCEAPLHEHRSVKSSNGKSELRPVIRTQVHLGEERWEVDLTLTSRDEMGFRMLLGREAVRGRFYVDPGRSYLVGHAPKKKLKKRKKRRK